MKNDLQKIEIYFIQYMYVIIQPTLTTRKLKRY
uniref:Uncharacterized protein n=1 Tax=viral metagenome TaxID=1070528 RepID=A0A6C0HI04_9ZZZZ